MGKSRYCVSYLSCKLPICQRKNKARKGRWKKGDCSFFVTCYSVEVALCTELYESRRGAFRDGKHGADLRHALSSCPFLHCVYYVTSDEMLSSSPLDAFLFSWQGVHKLYLVADFWGSFVVLGRGCLVLWMPFSVIGRTRGRPHMLLAAEVLMYPFRVFAFNLP